MRRLAQYRMQPAAYLRTYRGLEVRVIIEIAIDRIRRDLQGNRDGAKGHPAQTLAREQDHCSVENSP
jgi:hypothetical protein